MDERWQGGVDARLDEHGRRLDTINGDSKRAREASEKIVVEIAVLKTKVAVWSGVGSLVGAGVVTFVVRVVAG